MAAMGLLELGSKVRTSKMPPQLTRSLCLPRTSILVGSRVRQARPAAWMYRRAEVSWTKIFHQSQKYFISHKNISYLDDVVPDDGLGQESTGRGQGICLLPQQIVLCLGVRSGAFTIEWINKWSYRVRDIKSLYSFNLVLRNH